MMQPPKRVATADIPGREYIFIVDVSGSMHGFPLEISKKLLADLIGNLRPTDRFNVLLFSGGSSVMSEESLPATQENVARAIHLIDRQQGRRRDRAPAGPEAGPLAAEGGNPPAPSSSPPTAM